LPRGFTWKAHFDGQKFRHWLIQCKQRRLGPPLRR
jgi:hypothetical protein